ncbi:unnamed protein product [Durusdinium trenchii]|uniref:C2 domain-containing protein n=1 Tax=Durusdinium trenchii TaxID=1381693 RepID=A0ABP0NRH5_9DINO
MTGRYVYMKIVDQVHGDKVFKSNVSSESSKPVWEFVVEETVMVDSMHGPPRLEIQLYGQRVLLDVLDRYLGQAILKLPVAPTAGPMKSSLPVVLNTLSAMNDKIAAQFGAARKARLNVVWQVCDEKHPGPVPDLIRIAEMDEDAADKKSYQFHLKLVNVKLRRATEGPRRLAVCLRLIKPDGGVSKASPVQYSPQAWCCPEKRVQENLEELMTRPPPVDPDEECTTAVWHEDRRLGWMMPTWVLRESHLQLLSYTIEAQLLMYNSPPPKEASTKKFRFFRHSNLGGQQEEKPTKLGVWRESLGDLLDSIEQADEGIVCEAPLNSSGSEVATLRMEIDVSSSHSHRLPAHLVGKDITDWPLEKAPLRRGSPAKEVMHNKVQYYVTVMVDGLPNHEMCLPYVRVSMSSSSECTEAKTEHSVSNVTFDKALVIQSTLIQRKAKIEILNKATGSVFNEDKVIGEGVIYDLEPDKDYWIHCYGGAAEPTYPDVALQMTKGAVKPASTYSASLAIKFGTKMASKSYFESMKKMRKPHRLRVRFYSGVNLNSYANQKVKVIVKVPGCRLPDEAGAQEILRNLQELESLSSTDRPKSPHSQMRRKALLERVPPPERFNSNLLSFPAEVDAQGLLHFTEREQRLSWVERATPAAWPLEVPPNVQFADFYIVAVGEETEPPRVFGRLRMFAKALDTVAPKWKQLHFDTSVVALPEAYFKSNLAGFVLGSASLMPETGTKPSNHRNSWSFWSAESPLLPSAQKGMCCGTKQVFEASSGEEVRFEVQKKELMKTVFCHVDLLAARELPAMDDDGLVDPSYSIEVKDQTLLYLSGIMKSLSPSFMHRIRIPIQMEVEPEPTVGLPMMASAVPFPPIIVKILDRDERKVLGLNAGDTFEEVGRIVIKPSPARTHCIGRCGDQRVEVYPLLGYANDEDYVLGNHGSLFASKKPENLDLNRHHVAKWYALDKAAQAPFDTSTGGEEDSWQKRPRVLAAANYSFQANLREGLTQGPNLAKGAAAGISIHQLRTHQSSRFKIDFCLLGLRNLPSTVVDCKLYVSSFWEGGAIELAIASGGFQSRNFNFMVDEASEGWRSNAVNWKPFLRVDDESGTEEAALWTVKLKDFLGVKIQPPVYEVPVIQYLQQEKLKPGRWTMHELDSGKEFDLLVRYEGQTVEVQKWTVSGQLEEVRHPGHFDRNKQVLRFTLEDTEWSGQVTSLGTAMPLLRVVDLKDPNSPSQFFSGTWHEEDPFVLLPSITIQLKNPSTGADHGTLTVGLNQLGMTSQTMAASWMQICNEELAKLPEELHQWSYQGNDGGVRTGAIQPLRGIKYMDEAYESFVDVFASHGGFVDFDDNLFISRTLQDNCLFKICPNADKEDDAELDGSVTQFFNVFDWVAGDRLRLSEPFDERFWPQLCCGPGYDKEPQLEELPHIPDNCSVDDADRLIGKILAWMDAKEFSINHTHPRPSHPLGPAKLFEKFFQIPKVASFAGIKKHDLESMSTTKLHRKLRKVGWRFSTHLAAPELVPSQVPSRSVLKFFTDSQLHVNRHTFMVQVGHQIGTDRDSRILCRLRMDLPKNFLEPHRKLLLECRQMIHDEELMQDKSEKTVVTSFLEQMTRGGGVMGQTVRSLNNLVERLKRIQSGSSNYFMVKFKQPGVVVWAAPEQQKAWDRPGTLLFAVKLLHQPDTVVPVVVPSFDLRYPQENSWKVQKTIHMRFHDAERRIALAVEKEREAKGTESIRRSPAAPDLEAEVAEDLDDNRDMASLNPSSHGRMATSADAFICRLKRKAGALPFDREQNSDWYRLVLGESFPELKDLSAGNDEWVKEVFFSKFMNLQRTLALPSDTGETVLKGHVKVQKVDDEENEGYLDANDFAVENLWTASTFFVSLTLCTFTKLDHNVDCAEIYFKVRLGNEEQQTPVVQSSIPQTKIIGVYHSVTFETQVPGAHELNVQVFAKAALGFGEQLIGECDFDLEDRCLAMKWKEFRSSTNETFLRNHLSPPTAGRFHSNTETEGTFGRLPWTVVQAPQRVADGRGVEVRPSRAPGARLPLESKVICMKDADMNADSRVGLLRCVLDMHPQNMPEQPRTQMPHSFQIRVSIINVDNIKVYKDFGQRNDLFVEMKFRSVSMDGTEQRRNEKTDIHGWAHDTASFNQRFLFNVMAPTVKCGLEFSLMDFDRGVSSADLVYFPQTFSLDHLVDMAYDDWSNNREPVGLVGGNVVFDSWPSTNMVFEGWQRRCRCIRRAQQKGSAAKMNLTVEILPSELAEAAPVTSGVFAPPKDRLSIQMLATNPLKSIRVVLGPKLFNLIIVGTFLGCSMVTTFLVILTIFHTQQIVLVQSTG